MTAVTYAAGDRDRGQGMSAGLARGLLALHGADDITGEGLGLGAIAVRHGPFTYFGELTQSRRAGRSVTKHFRINRRLLWTVWGRPSPFVTKLGARSTKVYMSTPLLQKTLMHVRVLALVKRILGLGTTIEAAPQVAAARCDYQIGRRGVAVTCRLTTAKRTPVTCYVMNELSADTFQSAVQAGRKVRPPSGWEPLDQGGDALWLASDARNLRFTVQGARVTPAVPVRSFWGREKAHRISWAGFEIELELGNDLRAVTLSYEVALREPEGRS